MPMTLKGTTKYKVPPDAKPGDEVEVTGNFDANQDDFEGALTKRLSQQEKKHAKELSEKEAEYAEALKKASTTTPAAPIAKDPAIERLVADLAATNAKLAEKELKERISAQLSAAGLDKAPKVIRDSIRLKADATDEDITAAVEALKADPELTKFLGEGAPPAPIIRTVGARGAGGSADQRADQRLVDLKTKMERNAPHLKTMFSQISEPAEQIDILSSWEAQGSLEAKKP